MFPADTTSRPRPPAKVRRSTSSSTAFKTGASPPPPYASSKHSFLHENDVSNMAVPATSDADAQDTGDWINEKSHEELSELLVKADSLIRERENELGVAAVAVKALHESNVSLKAQHQTLLSRIPGSLTFAGNATLSPYPTFSSAQLAATPHYYSDSLPRNQIPPPESLSSSYELHARKVSVSQHDLSLLADQNAELLQKLERLEAESAQTDRAGRRELKRLERELGLLKGELERTQARSHELEEKARSKNFASLTQEELQHRKVERAARTRAMRVSTSIGGLDEMKDFAPENPLFITPPKRRGLHSSASVDSLFDRASELATSSRPMSVASITHLLEHEDVPPREAGLISQLMAKMRELEDANAKILSHQEETTRQLQDVQKETEGMVRLYDCLNDQRGSFELEMVEEHSSEPSTPEKPANETSSTAENIIRFRNLRKTLEASMLEPLAFDTEKEAPFAGVGSIQHPRKSVMDLFEFPARKTNSVPPISFPASNLHDHSEELLSPALSTLSIGSPSHIFNKAHHSIDASLFQAAPSPFNSPSPLLRGSTLDNELGSDWGLSTGFGNHHLRKTSLYTLTNTLQSMPNSPSPQPLGGPSPSLLLSIDNADLAMTNAPRLAIEPPTPERSSHTKRTSISQRMGPVVTPLSPPTERFRKLSETVRARTSKWADGRFDGSLASIFGPKEDDSQVGDFLDPSSSQIVAPGAQNALPPVLENVIDVVFEKLHSMAGASLQESQSSSASKSPKPEEKGKGGKKEKRADSPSNAVKFILEIWLWLQFIIIVLVFVGAMFHRGPRSVLSDAHKRKAVERR